MKRTKKSENSTNQSNSMGFGSFGLSGENSMMTVDDLCRWLKISRPTTDRLRKQGMPFIKKKRFVRFEKSAVLKWLSENNTEDEEGEILTDSNLGGYGSERLRDNQ